MIFIDSGAFIARFLIKDQYHEKALKIWEEIHSGKERYLTSNFVLNEVFTYLSRRATYSLAIEKAHFIYSSREIVILRPEEEDEIVALELFEKFSDKKIGFTDCISFVLMKKARIKTAFSFDKHFEYAGFELIP